ncbi:E3 ubiquitin-protein ligase MARCH3-like [Argonauta hians]
MDGNEHLTCRICHESNKTDLVSPCFCRGTMSIVHLSCLEKWLMSSLKTSCEVCGYEYDVIRKTRPFTEFLRNPGTKKAKENFLADIFCLLGLLTFTAATFVLSFEKPNLMVPGLIFVTFFMSITYAIGIEAFNYHYFVWESWKRKNQTVKVINVSCASLMHHIKDY